MIYETGPFVHGIHSYLDFSISVLLAWGIGNVKFCPVSQFAREETPLFLELVDILLYIWHLWELNPHIGGSL